MGWDRGEGGKVIGVASWEEMEERGLFTDGEMLSDYHVRATRGVRAIATRPCIIRMYIYIYRYFICVCVYLSPSALRRHASHTVARCTPQNGGDSYTERAPQTQ